MKCLACSAEFKPRTNARTCSTACSIARKQSRELSWRHAHPEARARHQKRYRDPIHRAVRALFNRRNYA